MGLSVKACAVALAGWAALAGGAYFQLSTDVEKCFVETVVDNQVLTVRYRHLDNPGVNCTVALKDPLMTLVFWRIVDAEESELGNLSFTAQRRGRHWICILCNGSKFFDSSSLKWELSLVSGDADFSRAPGIWAEQRRLERRISAVALRAETISAENEYDKEVEKELREAYSAMQSGMYFFKLVIVVVATGVTSWQVWNLRAFFFREKVVE